MSETLQREVDLNQTELNNLQELFKRHKGELDEMNYEHEQKLKELESIRLRANEEIKQLSMELGSA